MQRDITWSIVALLSKDLIYKFYFLTEQILFEGTEYVLKWYLLVYTRCSIATQHVMRLLEQVLTLSWFGIGLAKVPSLRA